jgi:hypothetical protein
LFAETDLTEQIAALQAEIGPLIDNARATLAELDEPQALIGQHCRTPYVCPFFDHCAPAKGEYPITSLGGRVQPLYELMLEGFKDIRELPVDRLGNDRQRLIQRQTVAGVAFIGAEIGGLIRALDYPRYYLDFETISFAIPIWPGTRPYEALPFQWSCHIDAGQGRSEHEEFLDLSGQPPMRRLAESLLTTLASSGPILVYTGYEKQVLNALAKRYPDLANSLQAVIARLVDLYPLTKNHYYHPDMRGSWSIKAVLPTIAPELNYSSLDEVQDGLAAQSAYLEAIHPETNASRRETLATALKQYCRYDTLAMIKLTEFFADN